MGLSKILQVKNRLGLHARAAAAFVRLSNKYTSDIKLSKDGYKVDGKSILGVLSLAAVKGTDLKVIAIGDDADRALNDIEELFENGFGEGI
ncbi:MAG: HPr family phosphocarrier protein [Thermodesulfobacteriota bacterium]